MNAFLALRRTVARWESLLVILIVAGGVWSWTLSSYFLVRANLLDLATPYVFIGLMAFGLTFVVVAARLGTSLTWGRPAVASVSTE